MGACDQSVSATVGQFTLKRSPVPWDVMVTPLHTSPKSVIPASVLCPLCPLPSAFCPLHSALCPLHSLLSPLTSLPLSSQHISTHARRRGGARQPECALIKTASWASWDTVSSAPVLSEFRNLVLQCSSTALVPWCQFYGRSAMINSSTGNAQAAASMRSQTFPGTANQRIRVLCMSCCAGSE